MFTWFCTRPERSKAEGFVLFEEVFQFLFSKPSPNEEAGKSRTAAYAEMHKEVKTAFLACEKESRHAIGIAGVKERKPGYWTITDIAIGPDFHGKGYVRQIVNVLLKLAFEQGAIEVAYDCLTQNTASKQLALSCGFAYSHSKEAELLKNGKKPIQMVILAPGGVKGADYIDDVSYNTAHLGEKEGEWILQRGYEILLQKGARFDIIKAQKFDGRTILVVRWEPDAERNQKAI